MDYNTSREHLKMAQYGRNIQQMAQHLLTIEDKEKRLLNAEVVVNAMAALNPQVKQTEDYRHELWDHLHILTEFKLDVEGPYPLPDEEVINKRPDKIPYPVRKGKMKHLGHNLERLITKAKADEDPEKLKGYTQTIGYYMKLAYGTWHQDLVPDEVVKNELSQLSDGQMQYEATGFKIPFDPIPKKGAQGGNNFKNKKYKKNTNAAPQAGGGGFKKKYYKKNKSN